ncbi:ParM/StbA family protein (plasmid) [Aeromonas salmonicida]|nr:ParM/StbA family protein [Aeromonas salmonicida]WCH25134.1 ParM/StbA family protein [Aeromonas salmonicida]
MTSKSAANTAEHPKPFIALVALDDGSGNIACSFHDAGGAVYESHQPSLIEKGAAAGLGASHMSNSIWETEEGERFTVRRNPTKPLTTLDPAYQLGQANRVLAIDTMAKANLGGVACVVGCTLPVEQFYNRGDEAKPVNVERIQAKKDNLMKRATNVYGAYDSPVILHVKVFPEAFPAYYYCASKTPKDYPEEHKTLVVDLGEFTADLAIISTGDEFVDFSTHEHGIHLMVAHFRTLLARHLDDVQSMLDADIKSIIKRGYIGSDKDNPAAIAARIDVTHLIKESADYLNSLLQADIRELARGQMHNLDRIVFVGGGANWLREQAAGWHHTVDIPSDPHMAVVRGVQLLLQANAKELQAEANAILAEKAAV